MKTMYSIRSWVVRSVGRMLLFFLQHRAPLTFPPDAAAVFLLVGRITSLAKEKRQALLSSHGGVAEDELASFMRQVDELRTELEREKERMDAFLVGASHLVFYPTVRHVWVLIRLLLRLQSDPISSRIGTFTRSSASRHWCTSRCCWNCRQHRTRSYCSSARC